MSTPTSNLRAGRFKSSVRIATRPRILALSFAVWSAVAALLLTHEPGLIAVAGSFIIGWSHLAGRCGQSHLGALTPRGKIRAKRLPWIADVLVYTAAGALASSTVGIALGTLGAMIMPTASRGVGLWLLLLLALVAAGSELRLIPWRLPDPDRQTRREWAFMFPPPIPAALWGASLGVTFATVFTFTGTWLVLSLPIAMGDPAMGAVILVAHWFGRATPILVGPLLLEDAGHTTDLLDDIDRARAWFRASNLAGIGLMALALLMWITEPIT